MISSDTGIVLACTKCCENSKTICVLTKNYGRLSVITNIIKRNTFAQLSVVEVILSPQLKLRTKNNEKQEWIHMFNMPVHLTIGQTICSILYKILPSGIQYCRVFNFLSFFLKVIHNLSKCDAIKMYAYFEFLLLKEIGFGFDMEVCSACGCREKVSFVSHTTGRTISSNCAKGLEDQLFRIPDIWKSWDKIHKYDQVLDTEPDYQQLLSSLYITWHFINKNVIEMKNCFRDSILSAIAA